MKRYFIVSLCKHGILGGGITADSEAITYRTGKVTVPKEIRHLEMKYRDIETFEPGWMLVFPTVTITMKDCREYKFIVFGRKRMIQTLLEMGVKPIID